MSPDADLVFLSSGIQARGRIEVTPEKGTVGSIELDPVGIDAINVSSDDTKPDTVRVRSPSAQSNASNEVLGELREDSNGTRLQLWEQDSSGARSRGISVDTGSNPPGIEVAQNGNTTVKIERIASGGRIKLFDTSRTDPSLIATTTSGGGGELRLTDDQGNTTCHAVGEEGTLLLSGTPETLDEQIKSAYGGGELVLEEWQQSGQRDIHVHATGEGEDSDYGVDAGNRPRIFLDGPEATLELGRHQLGSERPAASGRIRLRDDQGATLLELRARARSDSEASLFWSDGTDKELRGRIRATRQGLAVYDAGGREALVIGPAGEVITRRSVSRL